MTQAKTRAVILISGSGSNLQAFIDQVASKQLELDISLVISNKADAYGLERASKAGIDSDCINHRDYDSRLAFDQALMNRIDQAKPDIVILAGFMRILTPEFVNHYTGRLINIHPSLEVDAGPVILQGRLAISSEDTPESLQQRIHKIEHRLYPLAVKWFAEGRLVERDGQILLDGETSAKQLQTFEL